MALGSGLALMSAYALCTFISLLVQTKYHMEQPLEKYKHKKPCCVPGIPMKKL